MITKCPSCKKTYDDARCWTICPHNPLDVGATAVYCKRHDLFNCYLCDRSALEYRELLGEYEDPRERELHELRCWKQEMLQVESEWSEQEVGELLGMVPGMRVRKNLADWIRRLLQRCNQAETLATQQQRHAIKLRNLVDNIKLMVENE